VWYHLELRPGQRIADAAWCYPEPSAGREYLKDHLTFATGKGIVVSGPLPAASSVPTREPRPVVAAIRSGRGGAAKPRQAKAVAVPQTEPGDRDYSGEGSTNYDSQNVRSRHASTPGSSSAPHPVPCAGASSPRAAAGAAATAPLSWIFSPGHHSHKFLAIDNGGSTVLCHKNCGRASQGTAFIGPPFDIGHRYRLVFRVDAKPGRMCYFIGVAPRAFDYDAGQAVIRSASFSLENLSASLHKVGQPCATKALPLFHVDSTITMDLDLASKPCTLRFSGLASGVSKETAIPSAPQTAFVSLYNRGASFTIVAAEQE
jgi:hypothetical protein